MCSTKFSLLCGVITGAVVGDGVLEVVGGLVGSIVGPVKQEKFVTQFHNLIIIHSYIF